MPRCCCCVCLCFCVFLPLNQLQNPFQPKLAFMYMCEILNALSNTVQSFPNRVVLLAQNYSNKMHLLCARQLEEIKKIAHAKHWIRKQDAAIDADSNHDAKNP